MGVEGGQDFGAGDGGGGVGGGFAVVSLSPQT